MKGELTIRLEKEMQKRGVTVYRFAKDTGIASGKVDAWVKGRGNPKTKDSLLIEQWISSRNGHSEPKSVKNTLTQIDGSRTDKTEPVKNITPEPGKDGIKNADPVNESASDQHNPSNNKGDQWQQLIDNVSLLSRAIFNQSEAARLYAEAAVKNADSNKVNADAANKVATSNLELAKYLKSPSPDDLQSIVEEMSVISRSTRALVLELASGRQFASKAAATAYMGSLDSEMMNEKRGIRKNANSSGN